MEEENYGELDTLIQDEGDGSEPEGISTNDDTDYKALAENYKVRAEKAEAKLKEKKQEKPSLDPEAIRNEARSTVREELDNQYLDDMEYPDEIKAEIKRVAKLNNVSIKAAEKDPYVQFKINQAVEEQRFDASAVRGTKKSQPVETDEYLDPKKFDLNTEEGRRAWKEAKLKRGK